LKKDKLTVERSKWIAEQQRKDVQREREREREHEREVEKERKERERMKEYEQRMRDYKPDVNIEYTDEFGKVMTPKEVCICFSMCLSNYKVPN
jgi:U4/U6.U5 tri-snRNP-associated protein 1